MGLGSLGSLGFREFRVQSSEFRFRVWDLRLKVRDIGIGAHRKVTSLPKSSAQPWRDAQLSPPGIRALRRVSALTSGRQWVLGEVLGF